jgi:hypothetical protein
MDRRDRALQNYNLLPANATRLQMFGAGAVLTPAPTALTQSSTVASGGRASAPTHAVLVLADADGLGIDPELHGF